MAKNRYVGKSALVKVNINDDGTTFTAVGLIREVTPPPEVKSKIDVTGMEDTVAEIRQGIEEESEFTFLALWDQAATGDAGVKTLYDSGAEVRWQVIVTDGTNTWTMDFDGIVMGIVPQKIGGSDPVTFQVTVSRTGAITHTVA